LNIYQLKELYFRSEQNIPSNQELGGVKYAKLVSDTQIIELNPKYIELDGFIYTNPLQNSNIDLKKLGYLELVNTEAPQIDENTQKLEQYYALINDKIYAMWNIINIDKNEQV
jgi:hypothetical protein